MIKGSEAVKQSGPLTRFNILSCNVGGVDCRVEGQNYTLEQCRERYSELCRTSNWGRILFVRSGQHNGDIDIMA